MFTNNKIIVECLIIGLISSICCLISYKIIYYKSYNLYNYDDFLIFLKIRESRNNIIICFIVGALVHYCVKQSHLTELYCKKVCYDDNCFMVCKIID
jgi:magnesium-transporting ATPase (P-type)